jgi:signal transduction histidine kinase
MNEDKKAYEALLCARNKVYAAVSLFEAQGEESFLIFRDLQGTFGPSSEIGCIGIHSLSGNMVLHPMQPSIEGRNLLNLCDSTGFPYVQAMNWVIENHHEGWVLYLWTNPSTQREEIKASFIKGAEFNQNKYFVGCGLYGVSKELIQSLFSEDFVCDGLSYLKERPKSTVPYQKQ